MERWAKLPGFGDIYEVSDQGRVRSIDRMVFCRSPQGKPGHRLKRGKVLSQTKSSAGYYVVGIRNGASSSCFVHRLVLFAFRGYPKKGQEAAHNNGVRSDNRLSNLRWDTRSGNHADKVKHGTAQRGEQSGLHKITEKDVAFIYQCAVDGLTQQEIADRLGKISRSHIGKIIRGKNWTYLPREPINRRPRRKQPS